MELIDKDVLTVEIEKRKKSYTKQRKDMLNAQCYTLADDALTRIGELNCIQDFLNTLEVKEVDLEKELDSMITPELKFHKALPSLFDVAKHFFGLGLKAKDWEKERMEECPYRQVGCTMYEGKILECRGACSWVVDYPKLKELKVQKGEKV